MVSGIGLGELIILLVIVAGLYFAIRHFKRGR